MMIVVDVYGGFVSQVDNLDVDVFGFGVLDDGDGIIFFCCQQVVCLVFIKQEVMYWNVVVGIVC